MLINMFVLPLKLGLLFLPERLRNKWQRQYDIGMVLGGLGAAVRISPRGILKTRPWLRTLYWSRLASWGKAKLTSLLLHEVITDMGLPLNFDWLFKSFVSHLFNHGITPGFNIRNFPYLGRKFREWGLDLGQLKLLLSSTKLVSRCTRSIESMSRPEKYATRFNLGKTSN